MGVMPVVIYVIAHDVETYRKYICMSELWVMHRKLHTAVFWAFVIFQFGFQDDINHCGHTTTTIWVVLLIPVLRLLSHHVQFLHLIIDKRPKMLGFILICVQFTLNL